MDRYSDMIENLPEKKSIMSKIFTWHNILRALLFIVAIVLVVLMLPRHKDVKFTYEEGKPWATSMLIATKDIPIYLDSASMEKKKDSIINAVIPNYKFDLLIRSEVVDAVRQRLEEDMAMGIDALDKTIILDKISQAYDNGVIEGTEYQLLKEKQYEKVKLNDSLLVSANTIVSPDVLIKSIDSALVVNSAKIALYRINLLSLLNPNLERDDTQNLKYIEQEFEKLKTPVGVVQAGERIIDRGEVVTPQCAKILETYEEILNQHKGQSIIEIIGMSIYVLILFTALFSFLFVFRRDLYNNIKVIIFILLTVIVFVGLMVLGSILFSYGTYVVPIIMVPIAVLVFFDSRMAMFCHFIVVLLCAVLVNDPLEFIFVQFAAGVVAIVSIRDLARRSQLMVAVVCIFIVYAVAYFAVEILQNASLSSIVYDKFLYLGINAILILAVYMLIFAVEKMFGFISIVTLVELSDVGHKVLKDFSQACPGTFNHSLTLSNLASAAAIEVDAKFQLVRAGALYHDIGKMKNPQYFTENQTGVNPHDKCTPQESAHIIINHVSDGLKLAEEYGLPKVLHRFIREHHGCGKAKYFYNTYVNEHPDEDVDPAPFTYPGPNPQSKETSILMMADAVEAASRSLKDYTEEAIEALVNRIIDGQVAEGLHNDSSLSFNEVKTIKKTFVKQLVTIYHSRISYPEILAKKEVEEKTEE